MKKHLFLFILLCVAGISAFAQSNGQILTFPANPKAGFEWGYLVYLPDNLDTSRKLPILFVMNNSGVASSNEEMQKKTLARLENNRYEKQLADQLGVPLLIPFVLREGNDLYPHELNRAVFVLNDGPFKRLDLQVVNIFKDVRKQLQKKGITTQQKMLVAGGSAAGAFAWRFTLLQPKYVLATVAAVQHYPTLPLKELNEQELIFPIGIADIKQYTGSLFNKRAWQQIPIFVYEGGADYNDPLPYDECYPGELRTLLHKLYDKEDDTQVRVRNVHKELARLAPNVQTHIYPNMGHHFMVEDTVQFLRNNMSGRPLKPITPTDTSSWPAPLPLRVSALYWGYEAPLTHDEEHLSNTDLTLKTQKSPMSDWVWKQGNCRVDILRQGKEIIHNKRCNGFFTEEDFNLFQVRFSADEIAKLKDTGKSTFNVRSHFPEIVDIPKDLTFTLR